jgi:hypothetical protein
MLRDWQLHKDYQERLRLKLLLHNEMQRSRLVGLDKSITKIYLLNLDNLLHIVKPLYSDFGRPAKNQQGIIRSLILMLDLQEHSITKWVTKLRNDLLLFDICGFDSPKAPSILHAMTFSYASGLLLIRNILKENLKLDVLLLNLRKNSKLIKSSPINVLALSKNLLKEH